MFLPTNEFNFKLNPLKPGTIVLELSRRSKRNLFVKKMLIVGLAWVPFLVVGAVAERQLEVDFAKLEEDPENPEEN